MVAPATRTSVGYMYVISEVVDISSSNYEGGIRNHTHNIEYGVQRAEAERTATLTLASWILLLLLLLFCCWRSSDVDVAQQQ